MAGPARTGVFGTCNELATEAGACGALAAGRPALLPWVGIRIPADQCFFLALVPIGVLGALVAGRLSTAVEATAATEVERRPLGPSKSTVVRLSGLFALDAFGGGFVIQRFEA